MVSGTWSAKDLAFIISNINSQQRDKKKRYCGKNKKKMKEFELKQKTRE